MISYKIKLLAWRTDIFEINKDGYSFICSCKNIYFRIVKCTKVFFLKVCKNACTFNNVMKLVAAHHRTCTWNQQKYCNWLIRWQTWHKMTKMIYLITIILYRVTSGWSRPLRDFFKRINIFCIGYIKNFTWVSIPFFTIEFDIKLNRKIKKIVMH